MNDNAPASLSGAWRWIAFAAMLFGTFIAILDVQVVASSLNEIQAGLSATTEEASWLQTSYLIAEVIAIPLSGFLSRMMSTRIYFVVSALGFTLASLACALSTSLEQMVLLRAVQGFAGGGMIPTTYAVMFMIFEADERTWATVLIGLIACLAPAVGPSIGGYLTSIGSWHWIFLINLLPGLIVAASAWRLLHVDKADWSLARRVDWPGLVGLSFFLGGLQYVLEEGPRKEWFDDTAICAAAWLAGAASLLFFYRMLTYAEPLISFAPLRDRNFSLCLICGFMLGVALYGPTFLIPLFLGQIRDYTATQIGAAMMATGFSMFIAAPLAGGLSKLIDNRIILAVGICMVSASMVLNGQLTVQSGFDELLLPQMVRGIGLLFCIVPVTELTVATLPQEQVQESSGLFNLARNLGGAFGLAFLNTQLIEQARVRAAQLRETLDPHGWHLPDFAALQALDDIDGQPTSLVSLKLIEHLLQRQALTMAFNDAMLACALPFLATLLVVGFLRTGSRSGAAPLH